VNFNRKIYFDSVRPMFGGLSQDQVNGQEFILSAWETAPISDDRRHLAYSLATTKHETASTMLPIEEYGKGKGYSYGVPDPKTGKTYYGRGFVQLTWIDNYRNATKKLSLEGEDDLEWHPERALNPIIAAKIMFKGMEEGWFRKSKDGKPQTLARYFNDDTDDAYSAREIINGDKHTVPSWSNGVSIGKLIADYHEKFLDALVLSMVDEPVQPVPEPAPTLTVTVTIKAPPGVTVVVNTETGD